MKKRTKQCFTAVTIAAMMVSSYGTSVPVMAAKVTLPKTAKVVVGAKKVLKLKNNKRAAKWKVSKGKKYVKIVKKSKKRCTVKGIKRGNATVQAVIGAKKYSCKVKVTAKAKNKVGESKRPSVSPTPEVSKEPGSPPNNAAISTIKPTNAPSPEEKNDKGKLKLLISKLRAKGSTVSEDIQNEEIYQWENDVLVGIDWYFSDIGGTLDLNDFSGLESVRVTNNDDLTALDVSKCSKLTELSCYGNKLTTLDVSQCTNLTELYCDRNKLTTLDVSKCANLDWLNCDENELTTLDISQCPYLRGLHCYKNGLTTLDVSQCTNLVSLNCRSNALKVLDVSQCTDMKTLYCDKNELTALDLTKCTELRDLDCGNNKLKELDVSQCARLEYLFCRYIGLTMLDVSQCVDLKRLYCNNNNLTTLDVTKCTELSVLNCSNNKLTTLDIRQCSKLDGLHCDENVQVVRE